jgi:hypothetical protein
MHLCMYGCMHMVLSSCEDKAVLVLSLTSGDHKISSDKMEMLAYMLSKEQDSLDKS